MFPRRTLKNIKYGIPGSVPKPDAFVETKNIYYKIMCDIDIIDLYTLPRMVNALENIVQNKLTSPRFYKCSVILGLLFTNLYRNRYLELKISFPIFDSLFETVVENIQVWSMKDAKLLRDRIIGPSIK